MSNEKISGNNVSESLKIILVKKKYEYRKTCWINGFDAVQLYIPSLSVGIFLLKISMKFLKL